MLARSFDTDWANYLANHESIRPHVGHLELGELDLGPVVESDRNLFLEWDDGGFLYHWTAPAVFEVHTMILPEGRGPVGLEMARASLRMAAELGAEKAWTRVKAEDRHTRLFTRAAGMKPLNDRIAGYELYEWRPECL